jgi:hypothetical protein
MVQMIDILGVVHLHMEIAIIMSIALDMDNGKLLFCKNGVWQNSGDPTSGATGSALDVRCNKTSIIRCWYYYYS